ncbi:hypothetical protein C1646_769703, partial [Rhizophagus diaphanus]
MACSKVFSGYLPELTNEIIKYFKKDFSTLYSYSKAKFNEYGINNKILSTNTLFNYPSFIKYLNTYYIYYSIKKSLFEVFVENDEGNLHSFKIEIYYSLKYFDNTMDLILQNPNLTYNIKNLKLKGIENTIPLLLLEFLNSNCNSISSIDLDFPTYEIIKFPLIEKHIQFSKK